MKKDNTTTINGQLYDMVTGLPVAQSDSKPTNKSAAASQARNSGTTAASQVHASAQRPATLRRSTAKKPATKQASETPAHTVQPKKRRPQTAVMDIARSSRVQKFTGVKKVDAQAADAPDIAPRKHPHELRANQRMSQKKQSPAQQKRASAKETKEAEVHKALAAAQKPSQKQQKKSPKKSPRKHPKLSRFSIVAVAIVAIIAIVIWVNLPSIWVRVASAQAGVDAAFPHFTPDGYSLQLPIEGVDNKVRMTFSSNQNDSKFMLVQEESPMDSQAVRAMVEARSEGRFITTKDRGLTIYTFDGDAAWVNGGILYSLSGDALLSSDAIMRIANSL